MGQAVDDATYAVLATHVVLRDLLKRRDRFIAQRIDATLRRGETGLLFLGALHHAVEMLPDTIKVK